SSGADSLSMLSMKINGPSCHFGGCSIRGNESRAGIVHQSRLADQVSCPNSLFELEVRRMRRAVVEDHHKLPARARPGLIGLPDVVVLIRAGVVRQAARARRIG